MNDMKHADIKAMQSAIRTEGLDGWLFFDHHHRDALAYRVLRFQPVGSLTRRWYYFIPAQGDARGLVHAIESHTLDALPGMKCIYQDWQSQRDGLAKLISPGRRTARQYSPWCAMPYISN